MPSRRHRELSIALKNIRNNRTIKPQNHIHLTSPQPCKPGPPPGKSQIFQGKEPRRSVRAVISNGNRRELSVVRNKTIIKQHHHTHSTVPPPCEPGPPPGKSQIFQGKEEQGSGMKNREIQKGFPGFEWSGLCSDVANHSRNDKMHTPPPMSNYLRGGCAKRWDALINQGKSQCHEVLISWEVRSYAYIMLQTLR